MDILDKSLPFVIYGGDRCYVARRAHCSTLSRQCAVSGDSDGRTVLPGAVAGSHPIDHVEVVHVGAVVRHATRVDVDRPCAIGAPAGAVNVGRSSAIANVIPVCGSAYGTLEMSIPIGLSFVTHRWRAG